MTTTALQSSGALVGSAVAAEPAGRTHHTAHHHNDLSLVLTRRFTMFQALHADLARAHQKRRQREFQRQLERRAQHELMLQLPRMLAR
ncbi:hypothetical protein SAMN05216199_1128 [Pedococcus cremeus]|jgi:hypothetical protein|uniref:Uncharacterized protein n=1 Tax=Pedococcus cremeus TaxID=587636 RepID=A0A1H9RVF3_9MICO|nr:hypothetical protein [Pedococcus cremeus]SER76415.1 hypothetical protein SAMN05216199_1128 [Pedococcus cremeus]